MPELHSNEEHIKKIKGEIVCVEEELNRLRRCHEEKQQQHKKGAGGMTANVARQCLGRTEDNKEEEKRGTINKSD